MSRWCASPPLDADVTANYVLCATQPAVDDPEMIRLVDEKVEAFWRSVESGAGKRGQVIPLCSFAKHRTDRRVTRFL